MSKCVLWNANIAEGVDMGAVQAERHKARLLAVLSGGRSYISVLDCRPQFLVRLFGRCVSGSGGAVRDFFDK
jgi:hypothetical protein